MLEGIKGFRIRTGKKDRDICLMTSDDVANYIKEHYDYHRDDITVTPLYDEEPASRERYAN